MTSTMLNTAFVSRQGLTPRGDGLGGRSRRVAVVQCRASVETLVPAAEALLDANAALRKMFEPCRPAPKAGIVAQRRRDINTLRESLEAQAASLGSQDPKQDAGRVLCRAARPRIREALQLLEERLAALGDDALSLRSVTESDGVTRRKLLAERAPLRAQAVQLRAYLSNIEGALSFAEQEAFRPSSASTSAPHAPLPSVRAAAEANIPPSPAPRALGDNRGTTLNVAPSPSPRSSGGNGRAPPKRAAPPAPVRVPAGLGTAQGRGEKAAAGNGAAKASVSGSGAGGAQVRPGGSTARSHLPALERARAAALAIAAAEAERQK